MQMRMKKKLNVLCECGGSETVGSLMGKIEAGAAELNRLLNEPDPLPLRGMPDVMGLLRQTRNVEVLDGIPSGFTATKCPGCNGEGKVTVPNGEADFDWETCGMCGGTGRVVADNQ
jgi:hypothetical protein